MFRALTFAKQLCGVTGHDRQQEFLLTEAKKQLPVARYWGYTEKDRPGPCHVQPLCQRARQATDKKMLNAQGLTECGRFTRGLAQGGRTDSKGAGMWPTLSSALPSVPFRGTGCAFRRRMEIH